MPLQNRANPWGVLIATPARGTMMGNRGRKFHRPDRTLSKRRWATHHWIACDLHYKNAQHEAMGRYYTSVFFLDEVTALAAGHRPCHYCRRADAKRFMALASTTVDPFDRLLHAERRAPRPMVEIVNLPDGAMIDDDGAAFAIEGARLLRWSFAGYTECRPRNGLMRARLLTPPQIAAILAQGYAPRWHPSAALLGEGS